MTTTDLIKILKNVEFGGITGKSRSINIIIESENNKLFLSDPKISIVGTGDGLITELLLKIEYKGEDFIIKNRKD